MKERLGPGRPPKIYRIVKPKTYQIDEARVEEKLWKALSRVCQHDCERMNQVSQPQKSSANLCRTRQGHSESDEMVALLRET